MCETRSVGAVEVDLCRNQQRTEYPKTSSYFVALRYGTVVDIKRLGGMVLIGNTYTNTLCRHQTDMLLLTVPVPLSGHQRRYLIRDARGGCPMCDAMFSSVLDDSALDWD